MTARKPKTAERVATFWAKHCAWYEDERVAKRAHLAGQRAGYARARREAREKLQAAYADILGLAEDLRSCGDIAGGSYTDERADGIRLAAWAIGIKLENV